MDSLEELASLTGENATLINELSFFEEIINEKRMDYLKLSDREKLAYKTQV